jgi:hypothetical protein
LFRELAVVSFGQVVSGSSIIGKMVNTGPGQSRGRQEP